MSDGHFIKNELKDAVSQVVGAAATAQAVSKPFRISGQASLYFRAFIICTTVTVAAGVTLKLQHSPDGLNFYDVGNRAQATVTADGNYEITLVVTDASDAVQLPLYPYGQIVCTTGAGDAATITACYVVHR